MIQGGHSKLSTKGELLNTNSAEPVHTNVKYASKWQCHKGLSDNVQAEFSGIQKFNWKKEMLEVLKPVAATVGVTGVALGIAAAVGALAILSSGSIHYCCGSRSTSCCLYTS